MIEGNEVKTTTTQNDVGRQDVFLTRAELALALKVSLRTVDALVSDQEITPVRLRGKLVRFFLPDVMRELREKAQTSKRGVTRRV
jgi:excisionase family DNA binding protein